MFLLFSKQTNNSTQISIHGNPNYIHSNFLLFLSIFFQMYLPSSIFHYFIEILISSLVCVKNIQYSLKKKKKKNTIAISGQLRLQIKPNNYVASQVLQILAWIAYYNEAGGSGGPRPNSSVQIEEERAQVNQKAGWRKTKRYFYSRPEEQLEVRTKLGRILSCWVDLC